ncbi:MAG: DNA gyrase subunit A [Myxococcales bacterium]|nr:DNA gyrase subunit A [Myxococcales bacterium]
MSTLEGIRTPVAIEEEMKSSFMDYAMSVIISRALPDVRDGLKPVHRRILYAQQQLSNFWNRPYIKAARVVGECMAKYHPHGDASIYDALVRMAQDFSLRYPLADGQGNWGSVDGDTAAAMRYTEVRQARITSELMQDIDKETVDWTPNYDEKELEPRVLPARVPNLLVNGSTGIAVGMATNIPPHNLTEVIDGCIALARDPSLTTRDLCKIVTGPDFPTAGFIYGRAGIRQAYETGRGSIVMRGRATIEENAKGRSAIIVTEIPYMVVKSRWLKAVADLVKEKALEGLSDIRDESDRQGMRVVFELKRDAVPEVVLNNLYKQSALQQSFGVIMLAIVDGRPKVLTLRDALHHFIEHRREVVTRRSVYELREAKARQEIVEGLAVAVDNIDRVIQIIRSSADPEIARDSLCAEPLVGLTEFLRRAGRPETEIALRAEKGDYFLSERQAQAILEMRLARLTGLERDKLASEFRELGVTIDGLEGILGDEARLMQVVIDELTALRDQYGDARRTEIVDDEGEISIEDMIADEDNVVTVSHAGYVKRNPISDYRAQKRGGRGVTGAAPREEDFVASLFVASTHDHLLLFTSKGRAYSKRVYELPEGSRAARGRALVNLLNLQEGERVVEMLALKEFPAEVEVGPEATGEEAPEVGPCVFFATKKGVVKKTPLSAFATIRVTGIIALTIDDGDDLIEARITDGKQHILLASRGGNAIRFPEEKVRPMGRNARGVRGIGLRPRDELVGMAVIAAESNETLLTVCERGYGKRTPTGDYPTKNRGGLGVITIKTTERNGKVVGVRIVTDEDDLMIITSGGKVIRMPVDGIPTLGRNTKGVRLVRLEAGEGVVAVDRLAERDEDEARGKAEVEVVPGLEDLGDESTDAVVDGEIDDGPTMKVPDDGEDE